MRKSHVLSVQLCAAMKKITGSHQLAAAAPDCLFIYQMQCCVQLQKRLGHVSTGIRRPDAQQKNLKKSQFMARIKCEGYNNSNNKKV